MFSTLGKEFLIGDVIRYMACITTGATILFPDEAFNPEATLRAVSVYFTMNFAASESA